MNDFPANPRSSTAEAPSGLNRALVIGGVVLAVITLAIVILAIIYPGFREALRDFAVIILALFQLIGAIVMALVAIALLYAVKAIDKSTRTTLVPKLEEISVKLDDVLANTKSVSADLKRTTGEVSTTVSIITEEVVRPAIRFSSYVKGFTAVTQLIGDRLRAATSDTKKPEHD